MTSRQFEIEFRRLYVPLGMYALRLCGDVDVAQDIVQDAFVKVWEMIDSGLEVSNLKAYMYRSVRNLIYNHTTRSTPTIPISDTDTDVPIDDVDTSERDAALWNAIAQLPERCREVFLLSKRDGLSNADIAGEMGISVKTVENQMTRALRHLRTALTDSHTVTTPVFFLPFL